MPEQAIEPAERSAEGQPFVDVAEHDQTLLRLAYELDQFPHLPATLGRKQAEVRDDHPHALPAHVEVDIQRIARLAATIAELEAPHVEDFSAGEKRIAEGAVVPDQREPGNDGHL